MLNKKYPTNVNKLPGVLRLPRRYDPENLSPRAAVILEEIQADLRFKHRLNLNITDKAAVRRYFQRFPFHASQINGAGKTVISEIAIWCGFWKIEQFEKVRYGRGKNTDRPGIPEQRA